MIIKKKWTDFLTVSGGLGNSGSFLRRVELEFSAAPNVVRDWKGRGKRFILQKEKKRNSIALLIRFRISS